MKKLNLTLFATVLMAFAGSSALASDGAGVYAQITSAILKKGDSVTTLKISGKFKVAIGTPGYGRYTPAREGFMFYQCENSELNCIKSLNDLKIVADKKECASYGERYQSSSNTRANTGNGILRDASWNEQVADQMPGGGVRKVHCDRMKIEM